MAKVFKTYCLEQVLAARFNQHPTVGHDDCRNRGVTTVDREDRSHGLGIVVDVDFLVANTSAILQSPHQGVV